MSTERSRYIAIVSWIIILLLCVWVILTRMQVTTQITQFMPSAKTGMDRILLDQLKQGSVSRLLLMSVSGPSVALTAQFSKTWAQSLRDSGLFVRVNNGQRMQDKQADALLFKYRYLLSDQVTESRFGQASLHEIFQQRLRQLASPLATFDKQRFGQDPTNEMGNVLMSYRGQSPPNSQHGVWFSTDGQAAMVVAETRAEGFDLDRQEQILAVVNDLFSRQNVSGEYALRMSGPGKIAVDTRNIIKSDVTLLSTVAGVAVAVILLLAYRSFRLVLLNALPLITAIVVALACVTLVFGGIHGITMAFGITIIGVAIDYSIHLFSHLEHGSDAQEDIKRIWPTMRLGVLTTCSGYLAMLATGFVGLTQLVVFAVAGLLAAAACTRWVLPKLLGKQQGVVTNDILPHQLTVLLHPHRVIPWLIGFMVVGSVVYLLSGDKDIWEHDLAALSPVPRENIALDRQLRSEMNSGDFSNLLLVTAKSREAVLQKTEAMQEALVALTEAGAIGGFDMASRYLPSKKIQLARQQAMPDKGVLAARLDAALQGLPFRPGLFDKFLQEIDAVRALPLLTFDDLGNTLTALRVGSLLMQQDDRWVALIPLHHVRDRQQIPGWIGRQKFGDTVFLNIKDASDRLVDRFRMEALQRTDWALLFILGVLWFGLRSFRQVLVAVMPVVIAIIVDVALLAIFEVKLSLFNLVALLLVFGIGIDYGLFFSRREKNYQHRKRTLHALLVCATSTIAVFGILSTSAVPVLQDIGLTVTLGVLLSFGFSMAIAQPGDQSVPE